MHRTLHKAALAVALSLTLSVLPTFAAEPQAADASAEQSVTSPGGRATFLLPAGRLSNGAILQLCQCDARGN